MKNLPRVLAQARPNTTESAPVALYTCGDRPVFITEIIICNQSGAEATFRLFLDNDGSTYDETTALFWDVSVLGNSTLQIDGHWYLKSGSIGFAPDIAQALTVTVFGEIIR